MTYFFDYGFAKDRQWLDGVHQKEQYEDGQQAFERFCEIHRNGKKAEADMKAKNMLPEGNRFLCTLDIRDNKGKYNLAAWMEFAFDAFNVLKNEQLQIEIPDELIEPQ